MIPSRKEGNEQTHSVMEDLKMRSGINNIMFSYLKNRLDLLLDPQISLSFLLISVCHLLVVYCPLCILSLFPPQEMWLPGYSLYFLHSALSWGHVMSA